MKKAIFISLIAAALGLPSSPSSAQMAGSNQTSTQTGSTAVPLAGNSGSANVTVSPGAGNRPFQGNNNLNNLSNMTNQNGPFFVTNSTSPVPLTNSSQPNALQPNSSQPNDSDITNNVRRGLISPGLSQSARSVSVSTSNGSVTLSGTVESQAEKNALEQNARGTPGVKTIVNQLQISPPK